jgi:hypothetical protein
VLDSVSNSRQNPCPHARLCVRREEGFVAPNNRKSKYRTGFAH